MKHLLIKTLAGSGLMLLALTARAQYQPRTEYEVRHEAREHAWLFDRARTDLDRAESFTVPFTGDRDRVVRARREVNECQRDVATGEDDRQTFGEAIAAIQRVVDLNHLPDRNRALLADDINALRDLQARLEG